MYFSVCIIYLVTGITGYLINWNQKPGINLSPWLPPMSNYHQVPLILHSQEFCLFSSCLCLRLVLTIFAQVIQWVPNRALWTFMIWQLNVISLRKGFPVCFVDAISQCPEQHLAHSGHSMNIYWVKISSCVSSSFQPHFTHCLQSSFSSPTQMFRFLSEAWSLHTLFLLPAHASLISTH